MNIERDRHAGTLVPEITSNHEKMPATSFLQLTIIYWFIASSTKSECIGIAHCLSFPPKARCHPAIPGRSTYPEGPFWDEVGDGHHDINWDIPQFPGLSHHWCPLAMRRSWKNLAPILTKMVSCQKCCWHLFTVKIWKQHTSWMTRNHILHMRYICNI